MIQWADNMTAEFPDRCLQFCFGDISDDVGLKKFNGDIMKVESLAVVEARHGLCFFVGFKFRKFGIKKH